MEQAVNTKVALVLFKSNGQRRDFRLKRERCVVGRLPSCDLQAPDTRVSRQHCEIRLDQGKVFVRDLGSSNGTFVNDEKIEQEVELGPGDRLAIGPFVFTVQIDGEPAEIEPPLFDAPGASATGVAMGGVESGAASGVHAQPTRPVEAPTVTEDANDSSVAGIDDLIDAAIADARDDEDEDDDLDDSSVMEFRLDDE
ncbi:MAG: FHA domain-containing protein [Planctomycetota bacterium]|nr:MAG: FHA domain-containing protein [Planctomycetota bacterium]